MDQSRQKKIAVVGSEAGALVRFRGPFLRALGEKGWTVIAAAPDLDRTTERRLAELGVQGRNVGMSRTGLSPLSDLATLRNLQSIFAAERPQVVFCYAIKPVIWGAIAARFAGVPRFVGMLPGLGYAFGEGHEPKRRLARFVIEALLRVSLPLCDELILQNIDDVATLKAARLVRSESRVHVVNGSGVELDIFQQVELPQRPSFLMLARLLRDKGVMDYALAAREVRKRFPNAIIRIAGPEDSSPNGVSAEQLRDYPELEYLGTLDDIRPVMAEAGVCVLPSYYREGIPRSLLEAMAMGRAIITTDMPGCRETVEAGGNGFQIPPRDPQRLVDAMSQLAGSPELVREFGARSREIAETRFDSVVVARTMVEITLGKLV